LIYIHDTWDHAVHSMAWGGAYHGMQHRGVTVVLPAPVPAPAAPTLLSPDNGAIVTGLSVTFQWSAPPGAVRYRLEVSSDPLFGGGQVYNAVAGSASQSVILSGGSRSTYYWRVYAGNAAGGWSGPSQVWSFIYAGPGYLIGTSPAPSSSAGGVAAPAPAPPAPLPPPVVQVAERTATAEAPGTRHTADDVILAFSIALLAVAGTLGTVMLGRRRQQRLF